MASKHALVIGVSYYESNYLQSLEKPSQDAEAIAEKLERYGGFKVTRVPRIWNPSKGENGKWEVSQESLTAKELNKELGDFLKKKAPFEDTLIYFSGHGFAVKSSLQDEEDAEGYLAASDCIIEPDSDNNWIAERPQKGISFGDLNSLIGRSNVKSLVLILDCCYSGYILTGTAVRKNFPDFKFGQDYYLIAASRGDAYEWKDYSLLTEALLKGLEKDNAGRDGRITGDRLFDFIDTELHNNELQESLRMGWGHSITIVEHPIPKSRSKKSTSLSNPANKGKTKGLSTLDEFDEEEFIAENPYLGLQPFEYEQANYFGGREKAIRALLDLLTNNRFVAVIGASGSGKSSLVKAGLVPELKENDRIPGSRDWEIVPFRPSQHTSPADDLEALLAEKHEQQQPFLLFIDQFEEIFTPYQPEEENQQQNEEQAQQAKEKQQRFIQAIAEEAHNITSDSRIVITLRGDFLDQLAQYPEAAELINQAEPTTYLVSPLNARELQEAVEKPAAQHGVTVEDDLIDEITKDMQGQAGSLPLLQYALKELWQECIQGESRQLTLEGYEKIGRIQGALQKRAEEVYEQFQPEEQALVKPLMLELVQGKEPNLTRRRVTRSELRHLAPVIERLTAERLLVKDNNMIEVAHEALFSAWGRYKKWITENSESIQRRDRLQADYNEWDRQRQGEPAQLKGKRPSDEFLLPPGRLAEVEEWLATTRYPIKAEQKDFIEKSKQKRDREKRKAVTIAWTVAGLAIAAFVVSFWAFTQQRWAKQVVLASFFGVSQPKQVQQILSEGVKAIDDGLKEASQLKGKNDETALQYYRQIREKIYARLDEVRGLQKDAKTKEDTTKLKEFQKALEGKLPKAEDGLIELIEQHRIQTQLKDQLEQNKIKEAVETTRKILMKDTGADRNSDKLISSDQELPLIPCPTLKSIQDMWDKHTGCRWLDSNGEFSSPNPNCKVLRGQSLTVWVFDMYDQSFAGQYIKECKISPGSTPGAMNQNLPKTRN